MKFKFLFFMFFMASTLGNEGPRRFVLLNSRPNYEDRTYTAFYLDTLEQQMVKKEVSWNKEFSHTHGHRPVIKFEKYSNSLLNENSSLLRSNSDLSTGYKYYPLSSSKNYYKSKEKLKKKYSDKLIEDLTLNSLQIMDKSSNRYKLIQVGKQGDKQVGVYYNKAKGDFVVKKVKSKNKKNNAYVFPGTVGPHFRANINNENFQTFDSEEFSANTPLEFDAALKKIKKSLSKDGITLDISAFSEDKSNLQEKMKSFVKIKSKEVQSGPRNTLNESWYSPELNQVVFRKIQVMGNGQTRLLSETLFSLNDQASFKKARSFGYRLGLFKKNEFNKFQTTTQLNSICMDSPLPISSSENNGISDIQKVTDYLMDEMISSSLSENLIVTENQDILLDINIADQPETLKINVTSGGMITNIFFNPDRKESELLKITEMEGLDGKKIFNIQLKSEDDGSWVTQMSLESNLLEGTGNIKRGGIIVKVKGKKEESEFAYDDFQTFSYKIDFRLKGGIVKTFRKKSLDDPRTNPYSLRFNEKGKGGVKNFLFQAFFNESAKRKKIENTIFNESKDTINNNDQFRGMFSDRELRAIASEVTETVSSRTEEFNRSANLIQAVASEESFKKFGKLILQKTIEDLVPGESDDFINNVIDGSMSGFNECLAKATATRNPGASVKCMDVFQDEAPVFVGEEILGLKVGQAGMGPLVESSKRKYRACIKQYYDPKVTRLPNSHYKLNQQHQPIVEELSGDIANIQGCVYSSLLLTMGPGVGLIVDNQLNQISEDMGIDVELGDGEKKEAISSMNECLEKEKMAKVVGINYSFDFNYLKSLDSKKFEGQLYYCTSEIVEYSTRIVAKAALKKELSSTGTIPLDQLEEIINSALKTGLDPCIYSIMSVIENARNKAEVIPQFEPTECTRIITNEAVSIATVFSIKDMLNEENYLKLNNSINPEKCFNDVTQKLISELPSAVESSVNKTKDKKAEIERRNKNGELETLKCLKTSMQKAAYYAAPSIVKTELLKNPDYSTISLTENDNKMIGEVIEACFELELGKLVELSEVTSSQEKVQALCGARLLQNENIQKTIFNPIIEMALLKYGLKGSRVKELTDFLRENLSEKIKDFDSIDEILKTAEGFQKEAVLDVAQFLIDDIGEEVLGKLELTQSSQAFTKSLLSVMKTTLNIKDGNGKTPKFDFLNQNNNDEDSDSSQTQVSDVEISLDKYLSLIDKNKDKIEKYINLITSYSGDLVLSQIKELNESLASLIKGKTGEIKKQEMIELLFDESELLDTLIKAIISDQINTEISAMAKEYGITKTTISKLSSKAMIEKIFGSGSGQSVIDELKDSFLKPILEGKTSKFEIPPYLLNKAKLELTKDRELGGFVETLAGDVIQNELNDQFKGRFGWLKKQGSRFVGLQPNRDFVWGNDKNDKKYHLRNQKSAPKVINFFTDEFLKPILSGTFDTKEEEKKSKDLQKLIMKTMKEN